MQACFITVIKLVGLVIMQASVRTSQEELCGDAIFSWVSITTNRNALLDKLISSHLKIQFSFFFHHNNKKYNYTVFEIINNNNKIIK